MIDRNPPAEPFRKAFLVSLTIGITVLFLVMIRQFLLAVLLAAIFSAMAHPLYASFLRRMAGRRALASVSTLLVILIMVGLPFLAVVGLVANQAVEVSQAAGPWIEQQITGEDALDRRIADFPLLDRLPAIRSLLPTGAEIVARAGEAASATGKFLVGSLAGLTRGTLGFMLQFFVMAYAMFYFLIDGRSMLDRILHYVPLSPADEERLLEKFVSVARATLKGSLLIGMIQGALAGVAFWLAGVPGAAFWGTITVVASIVPSIGAALVWLPIVIYLLVTGHAGAGLWLLAWGLLVVSTIDNFLRPRFVGRDTRMSDLLVLLSTLGGLFLFGPVGFIVGPIVAALFVTVWHIYGEAFQDQPPEAGPSGTPLPPQTHTPEAERTPEAEQVLADGGAGGATNSTLARPALTAASTRFGRLRKVRLGAAVLLPLVAAGCAPEAAVLSLVERSLKIAELFETSSPYSERTVDSLDVGAFFAKYPGYRSDSTSVVAFYRRRDMQFAWIVRDSLSASAITFVALAGTAPTGEATATGPSLRELYNERFAGAKDFQDCDSCAIDIELRLTAEFFRFADRAYGGYWARDLRELNWFIPRGKKDMARLLDSLAMGEMDLSAYEPMHPQYQMLKTAIGQNRRLADLPWLPLNLPEGMLKLEQGDTAELIGHLRHRLHLLGDLESDGNGSVYDAELDPAVRRFQKRHGLEPDGIIGQDFMRATNVSLAERLRTMLVNMERLRWMPAEQPADLLFVNIPEFRLHVYEGGKEVMGMGVVVGADASRTVIFGDTLSEVVFSPAWTLPRSITQGEILPKLRADPDYLRKNNMEIIGGTDAAPVVRQNPGASNALGRVKFLFPNSYSIYMHDTPSQGAFSQEQRAFSHGCIRLSEPARLAAYLLQDDTSWPEDRMREAMFGGHETTVRLRKGRPVQIAYFTAWVDGEGLLNFREDVYGHDDRLGREMFAEPLE